MKNHRILQFDYIRALAIVFVILIHSMGWINEITTLNSAYIVRTILDSVIYSGVPLFVMLSGALLLGKKEPISDFFSKRFKRLLIPFIIWSILVYAILYIQEGGRNPIVYLTSYVTKTLTTGVYGIYWYIYLILGLYLITPALRKICEDKKTCLYTATLTFTLYFIQKIFPTVQICKYFDSANFLYIAYFISGYAISQYLRSYNKFHKISKILLILFIVFKISISLIFDANTDQPLIINGLLIIFISVLLFSTLISCSINTDNKINKGTVFVSKTSYGIYLTHFMFISVFTKLPIIKSIPLMIEPFVMLVLVMICELALMFIINKTKLREYLL